MSERLVDCLPCCLTKSLFTEISCSKNVNFLDTGAYTHCVNAPLVILLPDIWTSLSRNDVDYQIFSSFKHAIRLADFSASIVFYFLLTYRVLLIVMCMYVVHGQRWALCGLRERCRISPPRFLAECCMRRLNQASFGLLYFALFDYFWVVFSFCSVSVFDVSSVTYFPACTEYRREWQCTCIAFLFVLMCR